jgi:hypothetical protein
MGYKYSYNFQPIVQEIRAAVYECSNSKTDGHIAWGIKQDLYQLKWLLDNMLKTCPEFAPEARWLTEQQQKKIWSTLKT